MRRLLARTLLLLLLLLGPVLPLAEPLVLGVQTHFAFEPPGTSEQAFTSWMQRSGLRSARDEMFWSNAEDDAGAFALRLGAARTRDIWQAMPPGFSGLLILDYGHPRHDGGGQPRSEAGRQAFARYADFVMSQGQPRVGWVELWNEWNMVGTANPALGSGGAKDYVELARATYPTLKARHPGVVVLAGSPGDDVPDWRWLRQAIGAGLLSYTDGVAVHLYNHCARPDLVGSDEMAHRLDALRDILAAAGRPRMPVYVTEVGWPTHSGTCGIPEGAAATHSLRFLLEASVRPWLAGVWFYELKDGGPDEANREHRFGLLHRDGSEKPAGCLLRELGARIAERPFAWFPGEASGAAGFHQGDSDRWLLWAREKRPVTVRLQAPAGRPVTFTSAAPCGLRAADLQPAPQGDSALVRLAPGGVAIVDVSGGTSLNVGEVR